MLLSLRRSGSIEVTGVNEDEALQWLPRVWFAEDRNDILHRGHAQLDLEGCTLTQCPEKGLHACNSFLPTFRLFSIQTNFLTLAMFPYPWCQEQTTQQIWTFMSWTATLERIGR